MQIKHYLALTAVADETAPAGDIFKVKLVYTIRPQNTRQAETEAGLTLLSERILKIGQHFAKIWTRV